MFKGNVEKKTGNNSPVLYTYEYVSCSFTATCFSVR